MDADRLKKLKEHRMRAQSSHSVHTPKQPSIPKSENKSENVKKDTSGFDVDRCWKEYWEMEERIRQLIQKGQYDEASQELSNFYNSHKSQDKIGGEFYQTFGFWLKYYDLYIELSRYEDRIINNEHNSNPHTLINQERSIERDLKELKEWNVENKYSKEIEYLNSRYENGKNSKDDWTKTNVEKECKDLGKNIENLIGIGDQ
ncbi:MAG: hypothetical protein J1E95_01555, partial [Muribaculaceae bacterium]|nr:hypothetical protein [Muribaculaceae bacterium]